MRADGTLRRLPRIVLLALAAAGCVLSSVDPFALLFFASYMAIGLLLAFRRPGNVVSWLVIAIAFAFIGTTTQPDLDIAALAAGRPSLHDAIFASLSQWSGTALFAGFAALAILFPGGHLPEGRWRRPAVALLLAECVVVVSGAVAPTIDLSPDGITTVAVANPLALSPDLPLWSLMNGTTGTAVSIGLLAAAVVGMFVRYRRAVDIARLQLRWLLASILFVLVAVVIGLIAFVIFGDQIGGLGWIPAIVAYPTVPIAIGVAILRYRLYDIDRIVNRALVYGAVTAILAGVFAAATALSQRVFIALTGETSDAAVVLTTLAVATLYTPVRKRVEGVVDRYFRYGQLQIGPYRDELQRLLDLIDPVHAARRLAAEAKVQTAAVGTAVTDRDGAILATAGAWPAEPVVAVALGVDEAPIASILVGPRRDGRPHDPARIAALKDVAVMAAVALGQRVIRSESLSIDAAMQPASTPDAANGIVAAPLPRSAAGEAAMGPVPE